MNQRSTAPVRALAAIALLAGFAVSIVVVASALSGGDSTEPRRQAPAGQVTSKGGEGKIETARAYVVQNGDTLTSIAAKTDVSVARLQALNPGVDPQILISGEKLKLR